MQKILILLIILSFSQIDMNAQTDFYEKYRACLETKITMQSIPGSWVSEDNLYKISFVQEGPMVNIMPKSHIQPYSFSATK